MTLGQKIKELRESSGMLQRQLASILEMGDGFLSKVESDRKPLKREHLKTLSKIFSFPYSELEALWIATKVYDLIKDEEEGLNALKVAEEQIEYQRRNKKKL